MVYLKLVAALAAVFLVVSPARAEREAEAIKVNSAKNLAGTQRVIIGQFSIGFIIERKDSARAGGGLMGNGFGGRSTVRSTLGGYTPEELQQATNSAYDARVVNVIYYIDFANSEEYGGWFRTSSAIRVNGSLALIPDYSKVTVIGPDYKIGSLVLKDPVAVGGDFFDKEDTQSGTEKAANRVANVIGFLGGVGINSSKKFSFTARPGAYVTGVGQATAEASNLLAQKLAALR